MLSRNIIAAPSVYPFNLLLGENLISLNLKEPFGPVSDVCVLEDTSAVWEDSFSKVVSGVDSHTTDSSV
jgi:hypothetical protein